MCTSTPSSRTRCWRRTPRPQEAAIHPRLTVIGIDPGLRVTGWGIVAEEAGALRAVDCGVIRPERGGLLSERLLAIFEELSAVIARLAPGAAAVETPFVPAVADGGRKSALAIGQAQAAAILAVGRAGLAVAEYAPAEVKQTVAGYGRGDKAQVQRMVRLQLGLTADPEPADAADALAVAICHVVRSRNALIARVTR